MSAKKRFTISVEIEIDNWLTQKAKKSNRSKSGLVSHLLKLCMESEIYLASAESDSIKTVSLIPPQY